MKQNGSTHRIINFGLGAMLLLLMGTMGAVLWTGMPQLENVTVIDGNGVERKASSPVVITEFKRSSYIVEAQYYKGLFSPERFDVIADDCLEYLILNDVELYRRPPHRQCDVFERITVNASGAVSEGWNHIAAGIRNEHEQAGFSVRYSFSDPKFLLYVIASVVVLWMALYSILGLRWKVFDPLSSAFIALVIIISLAIRYWYVDFKSGDYIFYTSNWYDQILHGGVWGAFKQPFSNYTPLYPHLLSLFVFLPLSKLAAIKALTFFFELLVAITVGVFATIRGGKQRYRGLIAFSAVLLLPTIIANGALWAQCDVILVFFLLLFVLCLAYDRPIFALVFWGLAFSLKMQAVFLAPLIVVALGIGKVKLWHLCVPVGVFFLSIFPSWIAGRPLLDLITTYFHQAGQYDALTINAPNIYQWLTVNPALITVPSLILVSGIIAGTLFYLVRSRQPITPRRWVLMALLFAVMLPFILPRMHERYFFIADIFAVVYAVLNPKRFYVAVILQLTSLFSYFQFLFKNNPPIEYKYLAIGVLAVILVLTYDLISNSGRPSQAVTST